jgi:hypothetical protein
MKKKLTADVSTLALEPLDTSLAGGGIFARGLISGLYKLQQAVKENCMMLCRPITNKEVKTKCCEANIKKEMQNSPHGTCPGSSSMM